MNSDLPESYHAVPCCLNCENLCRRYTLVKHLLDFGGVCWIHDDDVLPWGLCDDYKPNPDFLTDNRLTTNPKPFTL